MPAMSLSCHKPSYQLNRLLRTIQWLDAFAGATYERFFASPPIGEIYPNSGPAAAKSRDGLPNGCEIPRAMRLNGRNRWNP